MGKLVSTFLIGLLLVCSGCTTQKDQVARDQTESFFESEPASVPEPFVEHSVSTSSDGKYRIESYGVIKDVTAGGLYPAEGIRLVDITADKELWTMTPGYYKQSFVWSPDNRYVAVYIETRTSGSTFVVDTQTMLSNHLPYVDEVIELAGLKEARDENRTDAYFNVLNWVNEDQLSISFLWNGIDGYEGKYTFDVKKDKFLIVSIVSANSIENKFITDFTTWNDKELFAFLEEVQEHVRNIPKVTDSIEEVIKDYSIYFSQQLSEKIVQSLYNQEGEQWAIPNSDGGYIFFVPGRSTKSEVVIKYEKDFITIRESYEAEVTMYKAVEYKIEYDDKKPIITEWIQIIE
ncbi:hypothetical protein A7K91_00675 [Paenibacillus oryzae]|uniref:Uncharacterized protein n=1 Tax=Paenibacillus oryzae TaxID=1844972 RepID=A0A1A5YIJ0_9BACL|nr:hypothetical protein [Paenibacillus oryzae]OBR65220.1 hypothetical protein A7K91_00675 [Paenibacillus oryzae]